MVREAFELVVDGQPAGGLSSENWFDFRFLVLDAEGAAYAQVAKVYEGYARAQFTSADRYAAKTSPVQRAMALTAAIAMDIALYQHRGLPGVGASAPGPAARARAQQGIASVVVRRLAASSPRGA